VSNCSLEIFEGEIFGLLGPNGAGKSSIIRAISMEIPYRGEIFLDGNEIRDLERNEFNTIVGVVPQDPCFFKDFTITENLVLVGRAHDFSGEILDERVKILLKKFSLTRYKNKIARNLSGGFKRLLSIAMSTFHLPKLLMMDEPTVGLDPRMRKKVWNLIYDLNAAGTTIILTTHYLDEAYELCDRVAIIENGQILALDSPQQLIDEYGGNTIITILVDKDPTPLLKSMKKIENVIDVQVEGKEITVECKNRFAARVIRDLVLLLEAPPYRIKPVDSIVKEPTLADAFRNIVKSDIGL